MPWYRGPTCSRPSRSSAPIRPPQAAPLRLTVQDIYRFDARRIVAGLVEAGSLSVGDAIEFVPGGKRSRVKSIETWPVAPGPAAPRARSRPAASVAITLEDELFVERGQIGAPPADKPDEARTFTARVFWLHDDPLRSGELVPLRLGTQQAEARLLGDPAHARRRDARGGRRARPRR
jgi:bifunctional enzyme CysN/CysC